MSAALKNLKTTRFHVKIEQKNLSFTIINLETIGKTRNKKYIYSFNEHLLNQVQSNYCTMSLQSYFQIPQGLPRRLWEFLENKRRKKIISPSFKWETLYQWLPILGKKASGRKRTLRNAIKILKELGYITYIEKKTTCEFFFCEDPTEECETIPEKENEPEQKPLDLIVQENIELKEQITTMKKEIDMLKTNLQRLIDEQKLSMLQEKPIAVNDEIDQQNQSSQSLTNKKRNPVPEENPFLAEYHKLATQKVTTQEIATREESLAINSFFDYKKATYIEKINQLVSEIPRYSINEIKIWLKQNYPSIKISTILRHHDKEKLIQKFPHFLLTLNEKKQKENIGPGLATTLLQELANFSPSEKYLNQIFTEREKTQRQQRNKKEQQDKIEAETLAQQKAQQQQNQFLTTYQENKESINYNSLMQKAEKRANQNQIIQNISNSKRKKCNRTIQIHFIEELTALLGHKGISLNQEVSKKIFEYAQKKVGEGMLCKS